MMSYYLPEKVISFVKCFYVGKLALGSVDIVVCMDNGYVVEYAGFKIKRKCETRCYNADSIVPFSAYEPNRNFYVIKAPNSIVVVLREDKLKVLETYSTVQKYCIRDFSGKGFPMVGIWTKSSQNPDIITNFVDKTEIPEREKTIALSGFLFDKLQEIRKITREYELKLAERQELRERCTRNLEETIMKKLHSEMQEGATSDQKLSQLYVAKHWQRIHNNKWVLGTTVTNSSSSCDCSLVTMTVMVVMVVMVVVLERHGPGSLRPASPARRRAIDPRPGRSRPAEPLRRWTRANGSPPPSSLLPPLLVQRRLAGND
ncbi:uncharacterized protein LOC134542357 isoform X2 [Bacillus rossius redtenbacheri]|uniref:uncharacterized protein LOC134542357 isoform X2 n=1 Tax=Bacillus rossius redtenbacheri TaxID=93214 RepID=UPI002FDE55FE